MTVSSEQSRVQYATDGVATSFPVPFRFLQNQDLRVTLVQGDGSERHLSLDVDYSVTGAGQQAGGTLTTTDSYPADQTLLIDRIVSITQETAYQRNDPFPERAHERALDKLTMICQQLASIFGMTSISGRRVLMVRDTDGGIGFLPLRHKRANHILGFDANGDPLAIPSDLPQLAGAVERAEAAALLAGVYASNSHNSANSAESFAQTAASQASASELSAARSEAAADLAQGSSNTVWASTLSALTAAMSGKPANTPGIVTNDSEVANNGYYLWNGSVPVRMDFQPPTKREALPFLGNITVGASLSSLIQQGIFTGSASASFTDVPMDFPVGTAFVLQNLNCSSTASGRYVLQELSLQFTPWTSWRRIVDTTNPGFYQWSRGSTAEYRGFYPVADLNSMVQPGRWLYSGSPSNLPPGAPATGAIDIEDFGTYVYQTIRDLNNPRNGFRRIVRTSPVSRGSWEAWPRPYQGTVLSASSDFRLLPSIDADYIFTSLPANGPIDGPVSGDYSTRITGDWEVQTITALTNPTQQWKQRRRVSTNVVYGWNKSGGGSTPGSAILTGTYAFFGDSMTQGSDYPAWIADRTGLTALKFGFGGCNLANHNRSAESSQHYDKLCMYNLAKYISSGDYSEAVAAAQWLYENTSSDFRATVAAMASTNWGNVKALSMMFGTNDFGAGVALGNNADITADGSTFKGSFNHIVQTLLAAYPHLDLIFISSPWRWRISTASFDSDLTPQAVTGSYLYEYVDAMLELGAVNKVPVLDLYRTSGINKHNHAYMLPDGLHPGDGGYGGKQRVGNRIGGFLISQS